jgi:hypothetical protein
VVDQGGPIELGHGASPVGQGAISLQRVGRGAGNLTLAPIVPGAEVLPAWPTAEICQGIALAVIWQDAVRLGHPAGPTDFAPWA